MKVAIIGLPNVGKSTLFNALAAAAVPAENRPFCTIEPNVARVPIPDPRLDAVAEATASAASRPRVLAATRYAEEIWVAGEGSTEGGVITAAGGVNAAAEIAGNQSTSLEGVIAMSPDVIIIPQPAEFGAEEFRQFLLENEALAETPAVKNGRVHVVESRLYTTLSYWNIRGVEDLAAILWPDLFPAAQPVPFSRPE